MKIQTIGLFINPLKEEARRLVPQVVTACSAAGLTLLAEPIAQVPEATVTIDDIVSGSDVIMVLGGDGTILRAISCMRNQYKPILGINLGTLGFLAECMPNEMAKALALLAAGDFWLEKRMLLHMRIEGESTVYTALNDVVVSRGSFPRMIQADVYVDGQLAARYDGDGAVLATPTGSTAYSLSAGGPIVAPNMDCFVLSPICPHTLSSRPMVVSAASHIRVSLKPRGEDGGMLLAVDGAQSRILHEATSLHIRRSERTLPFVRFGGDRFFELLRNKLSRWGDAMLTGE